MAENNTELAPRGKAVIEVEQDNGARALIITAMNEASEVLLGYERGELNGRKLEVLLGQKTAEYLAEELEFTDTAADLGELLSRQREIRLRHRLGEEVTVACSVSRVMSEGAGARFHLLIPNDRETRANQQIRDFITLNLEGRKQLDELTGLPNHATAESFLPLLKNYLVESKTEAAFAIIRLDRHGKSVSRYGQQACVSLLEHVANCCRSTFRTEDVLFALSDHELGLILFDISRESARVVLNRLRGNIRNHRIDFGNKTDFSVTISIAFDMLDDMRGETLLSRCVDAIRAYDEEERNGLIELAA